VSGREAGVFRRFLRDNGLTLFFLALLAGALVGQAISGRAQYNNQQIAQGGHPIGMLGYLTGSDFAVDVAENWQSEFLQFFLYILVTVWLIQRGSPESKEPGKEGSESDADQQVGEHAGPDAPRWAHLGGLRGLVFSRSLGLTMGTIFLLSWLVQSIAGRAAYNAQQLAQREDVVSWTGYVTSADFWNRSLQNWQSEFLAVAAMAVLSVYLRQRGSPESKPVGASHQATGVEG
jgi:membrane protein implicated in regulation of membrane protease activity